MSAAKETALSLGSNLGDRRAHLARALRRLDADLLADMQISSLWESEPVEVAEPQPAYLNLCVVGRTDLSPGQLLERCHRLEEESGRLPGGHRRSRTLDLDLLFHGDAVSVEPDLRLPHPGLARRRFVLAPLAELRPRWRHPLERRSVSRMLAELGGQQSIRRVDAGPGWWRGE